MADFYVRHSLNSTKVVKFNITLRYMVLKDSYGDHKWLIEIGTTYPDKNGQPLSAKKIHTISLNNVDELIESAIADLCNQIDWSPFVVDKEPPIIEEIYPPDGSSSVDIMSNISFYIRDNLPSAGIDLSNMKVILNNSMQDFDITPELNIVGDPYEYKIVWTPVRVYDTYN